ncbi:MAG: hypothetical protein RI894_720 [Bacteroidota bacterium]|jgi:phage gpG-like protein
MQNFVKNIITDVRIDLTDEFYRNFERKAFFDKAWESTKIPNRKGSLMMRTGKLRRSIKSKQSNDQITWSSSLPYASLQNEGGEVIVTEKMKRYFWYMYYQATNAIRYDVKTKTAVLDKRGMKLSKEAGIFKALALQKVGSKMKIKQRQFIGYHPQVRGRIEKVLDKNMQELNEQIKKMLKP